MKIPALVEPVGEQQFRVTSLSPPQITADGSTRELALAKFRDILSRRLAQAEVVEVEVPDVHVSGDVSTDNPWTSVFGALKDLGTHEELMSEIREYRRQVNADPNRL